MARVRLISQKAMNHTISHLGGVKLSIRGTAQKIGGKAETRLAAHRDEGHAEISITYGDTDSFVNLDDEAALSIEFGHTHNFTGKHVEGLYIVTGAAGLA
jgi:hypothetical protein